MDDPATGLAGTEQQVRFYARLRRAIEDVYETQGVESGWIVLRLRS